MTGVRSEQTVALAFASGADLMVWRVSLGGGQCGKLERILQALHDLSHLAAYRIGCVEPADWTALIEALRQRVGDLVLDVLRDDDPYCAGPAPAFLMPVWPFDHEVQGRPASTGRLLGLDLQLLATPTLDQEVGAYLPGRDGLWLIHAQPLG